METKKSIVDDIINEINEEQISKGRTLALHEMRPIIEKYVLTNDRESENTVLAYIKEKYYNVYA